MPKIILNENQKKATRHSTGPLLVIAGAGTGKTRVIAERIRYLIQKKGLLPNEILALTFTEKAAVEMAERVGNVMPLGYEEPWINTFHSFADKILRKEGLEIGLDPSYKILSRSDQWILIKKNLFDLDLKYFRPMGNPTKFISAVLKFISRLQDENVSVKDFEQVTTDDRSRELAYIYDMYQKMKIKQSRLDFGDLIIWTIKLFEKRPNILEKYQKQFKHILVDEFQDTNYAQYKLIKMLFPPEGRLCPPEGRLCPPEGSRYICSLLAVGDDSQSIYKFRGAAISNILEFMKDFPKAKMITLTKNYRSTQKILDSAYTLIKNNNPDTLESKLKISKELIGLNQGIQPYIIQTETLENEVEYVISQIYEILAKEPNYTYKDIAILARANNHLDPFVMALKKYGIPYQLVGNRGLYDQDEVRDILALVKIIINPKDNISLYRVLNIDSLNIPREIITKILSEARYKKMDMWEIILEATNENLKDLKNLITTYQNTITKISPVELVYNLVNKTKYIEKLLENETIENHLKVKNLDLLLNIVKRFEVEFREHNKELPTIINYMDNTDLLIEAGDNPAQAEIEDMDTINLLTTHSSKGLEFSVVFMVNLVQGRFPSRNRSDPIEVPSELIKETLPTGNEHIQEERRLFYVGMTRTKKYLYMTLAKNYGGKRDGIPSGYTKETGIKLKNITGTVKKRQEGLFGIKTKFRDPIYQKVKFVPRFLSYSQINMYKTCPLQYKYRYVLNIPTPPSHALSFGITIHDTLRDFHSILLHQPVSLEELYEIYKKNWHPLGYENETHRKKRFEQGEELLENYFEKHHKEKTQPIALEKSFNIWIGDTKFFGRIDRIDKFEDGVEIIDYKTGTTKDQKYIDKDDQIAFYAIAAKEALNMNPKKLTYYFVESGEKISTTRTREQLEKNKEAVKKTVVLLKMGEFEAKPSMMCKWCNFKNICPFVYKG